MKSVEILNPDFLFIHIAFFDPDLVALPTYFNIYSNCGRPSPTEFEKEVVLAEPRRSLKAPSEVIVLIAQIEI